MGQWGNKPERGLEVNPKAYPTFLLQTGPAWQAVQPYQSHVNPCGLGAQVSCLPTKNSFPITIVSADRQTIKVC